MLSKEGCLHHAYLLRCWQERQASGEKPRWRFGIKEVLQERPRQGFDDLDALVTFLRAELGDENVGQTRANGSNEERRDN